MRIHDGSSGSFDRIGDRGRAASTEVGQVSAIAMFTAFLKGLKHKLVLFNEGQTWQDVPAAKLALLKTQEAIVCDVITWQRFGAFLRDAKSKKGEVIYINVNILNERS